MSSDIAQDEMIEIGRILKPFGVKGDLKVQLYIDQESDLKKVKSFYIKDKKEKSGFRGLGFSSLKFSETPEYAKVQFIDIKDRTMAEAWRLVPIYIPKDLLDAPEEGEFFVKDLLNLEAWYQNEKIGIIFNLFEIGGQEIFVIKQDNLTQDLAVPFNDRYVESVDSENQKIVFNHLDELL